MARRGMTGQLNMFDLLHSAEESPGEVEMVSLVPVYEDEPEVEEQPIVEEMSIVETQPLVEEIKEIEEIEEIKPLSTVTDAKVAMSRKYEIAGETVEIAYINYNKVRISKGKGAPEIKEFTTTKEAVDYYVEKMQELESDE